MYKSTVLALSVLFIITTASMQPVLSDPVYKHSGCGRAAKIKFPNDHDARKQFKNWCKDQWKLYKAAHPS